MGSAAVAPSGGRDMGTELPHSTASVARASGQPRSVGEGAGWRLAHGTHVQSGRTRRDGRRAEAGVRAAGQSTNAEADGTVETGARRDADSAARAGAARDGSAGRGDSNGKVRAHDQRD